MRGAFDFETWEWVNPLCCAMVWGEPGARVHEYIYDPTHKNPFGVIERTLNKMRALYPMVTEWWAHNMGRYDGLFMLEGAAKLGWSFSAHMSGSKIIRLYLRHPDDKKSICLLDSCALVPGELKHCAGDFELSSRKLFSDTDYKIDARKWPAKRLREGCITDATLALELVEKADLLLKNWGGEVRATFSGSALTVVKSHLAAKGMKIPSHDDRQHLNQLASSAYYGARVEVLRHTPKETLTEYDVCSSYPWAMSQVVPWDLIGPVDSNRELGRLLDGRTEGVMEATVTVPDTYLPPLPYRKGGIFFPAGTWRAWFPACELRYAIEQGVKVHPHQAVAYTPSMPFTEYINEIYRLKSMAKGALRNFAKLLLNGSYGKFAMKPEQETLRSFENQLEAMEFIHQHKQSVLTPLHPGSLFYAQEFTRWSSSTHYALASYVTGRARILLHQSLLAANKPAYCDSDSVHSVYGAAPIEGMVGGKLGQLKIEIDRYTGEFYAPKIYRLREDSGKTHLAAKGFPVNEKDFEQIVALLPVPTERMQLAKSQLKTGGKVKRFEGKTSIMKTWAGLSMKRRPLKNGDTAPWTIEELERNAHLTARSPCLE